MAILSKLLVKIGADTKEVDDALQSVSGKLQNLSRTAGLAGAALTAGVTVPLTMLTKAGLDATAYFERLGLSLTTLVAKEQLQSGAAASMAEALEMSSGKAQELMSWMQRLALQSPFTSQGIADAYRMSMAYGFTVDQSKRLTSAMVDFTAATGASEATMSRVVLALGQIQAKGKLAGQEVLQLTEAGLNVRQILADAFGTTTEEIVAMMEKGLIPAGDAIEAIVGQLETDFAGAAKRQAQTLTGLLASLADIKQVGLKELFSGIFEPIQPALAQLVDTLSSDAFMGGLRRIGTVVGESLAEFMPMVERAIGGIQALIDRIASADPALIKFALGFTAVLAVAGPVSLAVAGIAALLGSVAAPALAVAAAVAALGGAWMANLGGIRDMTETVFSSVKDWLSKAIPDALQGLANAVAGVQTFFNGIANALAGPLQSLSEVWGSWWAGESARASQWATAIGDAVQKVREWLGNLVDTVLPWLKSHWESVWNVVSKSIVTAGEVITDVIKIVGQVLNDDWQGVLQTFADIAVKLFNNVKFFVANVFLDLYRAIGEGAVSVVQVAIDGITSMLNAMLETINNGVNSAIGLLNKLPLVDLQPVEWTPISAPDVKTNIRNAVIDIQNYIDANKVEFEPVEAYNVRDWWSNLFTGGEKTGPSPAQLVEQAMAGASKAAAEAGEDTASGFASTVVPGITKALSDITQKIKSILFTPSQVTAEDLLATRVGKYQEKPDEYIRRLNAAAADATSAWRQMLVPAEILAQGEDMIQYWISQQREAFYSGLLPDQVNWDAFIAQFQAGQQAEAGQAALVQRAMQELAARGLTATQGQVEAMFSPTAAATQGITSAMETFTKGIQEQKPAELFLTRLKDDIQDNLEAIEDAGASFFNAFVNGASKADRSLLDVLINEMLPGIISELDFRGYRSGSSGALP